MTSMKGVVTLEPKNISLSSLYQEGVKRDVVRPHGSVEGGNVQVNGESAGGRGGGVDALFHTNLPTHELRPFSQPVTSKIKKFLATFTGKPASDLSPKKMLDDNIHIRPASTSVSMQSTPQRLLDGGYRNQLPTGYERQSDPQGRWYYVDHNTRSTSWHPPNQVANPEPLPSGWEMRLDSAPQYKRDYRRKVVYFRSQPKMCVLPGKCEVKIRRARLLDDSYGAIMTLSGEDLKRRLMISFEGEEGLDYDGVSKYVHFSSRQEGY